jgi:hypothetical protein
VLSVRGATLEAADNFIQLTELTGISPGVGMAGSLDGADAGHLRTPDGYGRRPCALDRVNRALGNPSGTPASGIVRS